MINENDIIDYLEKYFIDKGGKVVTKANTKQTGIDLAIDLGNKKYLVEAKGETSSKIDSNRYGKPFTNSQITNHIARAILTILKLQSQNIYTNVVYVIAFPNTTEHKKQLEKISVRLNKIDIKIYLVNKNKIEIL